MALAVVSASGDNRVGVGTNPSGAALKVETCGCLSTPHCLCLSGEPLVEEVKDPIRGGGGGGGAHTGDV